MLLRFDIDGVQMELTLHAVERYAERVKGMYQPSFPECRRIAQEIVEVLHVERRISYRLPEWIEEPLTETVASRRAEMYLLVGDDIAFAVKQGEECPVLTTCLTRGTMSPEGRARRNEKRQRRARRARERRALESWLGDRNARWH